jgi:hypothetical protein
MPTLLELANELRLQGPERLFESYPTSSVLVGLGILGMPGERSERSSRGTVRFDVSDHAEYLKAASLVDRVWFLTCGTVSSSSGSSRSPFAQTTVASKGAGASRIGRAKATFILV